MRRYALALSSLLLLTGCPQHWVAEDEKDAAGDRVRALVTHHHARLERAAALLDEAKVPFTLRGAAMANAIGFEAFRDTPVLAVYTSGKQVMNTQTRFQRAVACFGEEANGVLHATDQAGLLEPGGGYSELMLVLSYKVRDAIMSSDIGGMLTLESEATRYHFPLPSAKAYAEHKLSFRDLINGTVMEDESGDKVLGHQY